MLKGSSNMSWDNQEVFAKIAPRWNSRLDKSMTWGELLGVTSILDVNISISDGTCCIAGEVSCFENNYGSEDDKSDTSIYSYSMQLYEIINSLAHMEKAEMPILIGDYDPINSLANTFWRVLDMFVTYLVEHRQDIVKAKTKDYETVAQNLLKAAQSNPNT